MPSRQTSPLPRALALITVAVASAWIGCGSPAATTAMDLAMPDLAQPPPLCTDTPDGGAPATLASVEHVLTVNCTSSGCHGTSFPAVTGLDLRAGQIIATTVGKMATEMCGGVLITAGDSSKSYLYQKMSNPTPCNGMQMPRCEDGSCPLAKCEIDVVRRWIEAGAK